jgi:hypothetical protein
MSMDFCRDLIHHLDDGDLEPGHAPDDVKAWLETLGLEMGLLRFLQWSWPQQSGDLGAIRLLSSRDIRDSRGGKRLLPFKFLHVGKGPNGDLLVLDLAAAAQPGFVAHDQFWGNDGVDPRSCYAPAARTLASLLWRMAEGRYVPCDFYAAVAYNKFLIEERLSDSESWYRVPPNKA